MRTVDFLTTLLERLPADSVVVSSLGRTGEALHRLAAERTLCTDTMGDVAALSLGMALSAAPLVVAGVDTDGSFLMNLSVLTVLGGTRPPNHQLVVVDNGIYESAGGMPSRSSPLDWRQLFGSVGLDVTMIQTTDAVPERLPLPGTVLVAEVNDDEPAPGSAKTVDGVESSYIIERYIAGRRGVPVRRPAVKA